MLMCDTCKGVITPISTSKRDSRNAFVDIMMIRIIVEFLRSTKQQQDLRQQQDYRSQIDVRYPPGVQHSNVHRESEWTSNFRRHHVHPYKKIKYPTALQQQSTRGREIQTLIHCWSLWIFVNNFLRRCRIGNLHSCCFFLRGRISDLHS